MSPALEALMRFLIELPRELNEDACKQALTYLAGYVDGRRERLAEAATS